MIYRIDTRAVCSQEFLVEADSEEEAIDKILANKDCIPNPLNDELVFDKFINSEVWIVEIADEDELDEFHKLM